MNGSAQNNYTAEQAIIGLLLAADSSNQLARVRRILVNSTEEFSDPRLRTVFGAIINIYERGNVPDFIAISSELASQGVLDSIGGRQYLADCMVNALVADHLIEQTCELIHESYNKRKLLRQQLKTTQAIEDGKTSAEIAEELKALLSDVSRNPRTKQTTGIKQLVIMASDQLKKRSELKEFGVKTTFNCIDEILCGIGAGSLTIVGGRPSMGKSAFALALAHRVAKSGKRVAIFSIEMPQEQVVNRLMSSESKVDGRKIKMGEMTPADWEKWGQALITLGELPLDIYDASSQILTVSQIESHVEQMDEKPELVIIDYIQIMDVPPNKRRKSSGEYEDVSAISSALRLFANLSKIPVIALSQLSRNVETRANKRPGMADLKSSGAIEQDADHILLLYRDEYYNPKNTKYPGEVEIIIAKNRHGEVGVVNLLFDATTQDFTEHSSKSYNASIKRIK